MFDATNTTRERRRMIHQMVVEKMGYKLLFVESICNDPKIIQATIKEVKVNSPDYKDVQNDSILNDFLLRIQHYEAQYQPLDEVLESHFSCMKIFNTGNLMASSDRNRINIWFCCRRQDLGSPPRRPHPESNHLLSDEHPHIAQDHLSDPRESDLFVWRMALTYGPCG